MLDFINIALRTIMCLAFIAFVVRPMLLSMVRREPNTLELEEMAQLAVNSAFKEQFVEFYAKKPVLQLESANKQVIESSAPQAVKIAVEPVVLSQQEQLALEVENARLAELVKGHEEEMARRAELAAKETERLAKVAQEALELGELIDAEEEGDSSLEKMRQSMKKEKKKSAIPAELLAGNSYEDKLMVVRYVTEQEQNRVANAIRSMIKIGP